MLFTTEITSQKYYVYTSSPEHPLSLIITTHLKELLEDLVLEGPNDSNTVYDLYITTPTLFSTTISAKKTVLLAHPSESLPNGVPNNTTKVILHKGTTVTEKHGRLIVQFILDKNSAVLNLSSLPKQNTPAKAPRRKSPHMKYALAFGISLLIFHTAFLVPLTYSSLVLHKAFGLLQKGEVSQTAVLIKKSSGATRLAENLYAPARPGLSFFFLAPLFDSALRTIKVGTIVLDSSSLAIELGKEMLSGKTKNPAALSTIIGTLSTSVKDLQDELVLGIPPLQKVRSFIQYYAPFIEHAREVSPHLPTLMGATKKMRYVIFFLNNRELRPGGGFLGSFAELDVEDYAVSRFQIYDVYDADGRLVGHVDPPEAIKQYLQQPHWFLRDSNWSPSFKENVFNAQIFLEKELRIQPADGYIAVTESALEMLLKAYRPITVTGIDTPITADNLFFVIQQEVENNFFPGAHTKKVVLADIAQALLYKTDSTTGEHLLGQLLQTLEQKQFVLYSSDPLMQTVIKKAGWDGGQIDPRCLHTKKCISSYFLLVDANLGLSKVNYWVHKTISKELHVKGDTLFDETTILWENQAPSGEYPAGDYKNFTRMYLNKTTEIESISLNGVTVPYKEFVSSQYKEIGLYMDIKPLRTAEVKIKTKHSIDPTLKTIPLQMILQKQTGDINTNVRLVLGKTLRPRNFVPVEKSGKIIYNSPLESDKLFFIDIIR
jgi:Protein of unknown function (DUF4012)